MGEHFSTTEATTPEFAAHDRGGLVDFWQVYDAHYDHVLRETVDVARAHPEFGPVMDILPVDQLLSHESERTRGQIRRAVLDGQWAEYLEELRVQGASYARLGVSFAAWYEVARAYKRTLVPLLMQAFADVPDRLARALSAMLEFVGHSLAVMAESYMAAREDARFRMLVEGVRDYAIFMLDPSGRVSTWNTGAELIYGFTPDEILEQHVSALYLPDDRRSRPGYELKVAAGKGRFEDEGFRVRKDGARFWANVIISAVRDPEDALVGFALVTRDLTERRRVELELRLAKEGAEAASRELETFSYSVAHDLRAPLRAINGFSLALEEDYGGVLDGHAKDYLRRIGAATERMGQVIDALLTLARVVRTERRPEVVDLTRIAEIVVGDLRARTPGRNVEFSSQEGLVAQGDPHLLRTLLESLLDNAWKFTNKCPEPRVEFGTDLTGDGTTYYVRDNGAGFDMAYAGKLFTPFQRLHRVVDFAGTGIGLAVAERIVHRHGGRIWAEGAPGRGATFYFTLQNPTEVRPA